MIATLTLPHGEASLYYKGIAVMFIACCFLLDAIATRKSEHR